MGLPTRHLEDFRDHLLGVETGHGHHELANGSDPMRDVDERSAVLDHRVHDRLSTHPKFFRKVR